jgi:hypothetical protein
VDAGQGGGVAAAELCGRPVAVMRVVAAVVVVVCVVTVAVLVVAVIVVRVLTVVVIVRAADIVIVRMVAVIVLRSRGSGASLAIHPTGVTVHIVLFLPDRDSMLHFIDDVSARGECFGTMPGAYANPYRHVTDRQVPDSVYACGKCDTESLDSVGYDPLAFLDCERLERLVLEMADGKTVIVVADPALEGRIAASSGIGQLCAQLGFVDLLTRKTEHGHVALSTNRLRQAE